MGDSSILVVLIIFYFPILFLVLFSLVFSHRLPPAVCANYWQAVLQAFKYTHTQQDCTQYKDTQLHIRKCKCIHTTHFHRRYTTLYSPLQRCSLVQLLHICMNHSYYTHTHTFSLLFSSVLCFVSPHFKKATLRNTCTCTAPLWDYFEDTVKMRLSLDSNCCISTQNAMGELIEATKYILTFKTDQVMGKA